jgi:hypothetical protein
VLAGFDGGVVIASVAQSATALVAMCHSAPGFNSCILHFFFTYIKGIRLCLNTFIAILIKSLRIPCGMVHGIHMDCSMWTGPWIPYGIVHGFSIKIHWKFHGIHMESIWTVHGPVHGMHHSMDIPYGIHSGYGLKKWLGTQPKNSPYGMHGLGGGIHMELPGECKDLKYLVTLIYMWNTGSFHGIHVGLG